MVAAIFAEQVNADAVRFEKLMEFPQSHVNALLQVRRGIQGRIDGAHGAQFRGMELALLFALHLPVVQPDLAQRHQPVRTPSREGDDRGRRVAIQHRRVQAGGRLYHRVPAGEFEDALRVGQRLPDRDDPGHAGCLGARQHRGEILGEFRRGQMGVRVEERHAVIRRSGVRRSGAPAGRGRRPAPRPDPPACGVRR